MKEFVSHRIVLVLAVFVAAAGCSLAEGERSSKGGVDFAEGRKFWSFQPLRKVEVSPAPRQPAGSRIDLLVLARLESHQLRQSPPADKRTLIRRLSFDLTGLPPTREEVAAFLADRSPNAYARLVDRLLAAPHYGERWGRVWLDLARYTDVRERWVFTRGNPYQYRDWVVRALNEDMPYDQFAKRQLATDLMVETGVEDIPALGFLGVSPVYHKELLLAPEVIKTIVAEEWEERIDAVGRTFLGLTISCARCHDHKFDPIDTNDYYALAGVFASVRRSDRPSVSEDRAKLAEKARKEVESLEKKIVELREGKSPPADRDELIIGHEKKIRELKAATPDYDHLVPAVIESSIHVIPNEKEFGTKLDWRAGVARDLNLQIRGEPGNLGPVVRRRFLRVLSRGEPKPFTQGSGRLELADCLFDEAAALSARVMVNRIWLQHFGRGLVTTPSDFGEQGARPSHPLLLDDLAARFVEKGWSMKWLHREIVMSATYRQASAYRADGAERDPENKWLWRMNRRRLDVEAWRDAMMSASGVLDFKVGGPPQELGRVENRRRTIYGKIDRRDLDPMLRMYDFPDPDSHSPAREKTITPLQQLFVLNGEFVRRQAKELVERVHREAAQGDAARVQLAYELLYARQASQDELVLAAEYLGEDDPTRRERWLQYAQVLLGSNEFLFVD